MSWLLSTHRLWNSRNGKVLSQVLKQSFFRGPTRLIRGSSGNRDSFFVFKESEGYPKLTPQQVSGVLRMNETTVQVRDGGSVLGFESNQLHSNNPIEDRRSEARLTQTDGFLFGVFDGHAGCACAQAISERLFLYIAVLLLPLDLMEKYSHALRYKEPMEVLHWFKHDNDYFTEYLADVYHNALTKLVVETLSTSGLDDDFSMLSALSSSFIRLDEDISHEALPSANDGKIDLETIEVAFSGACACAAHIDGPHLHVANVGDARAVLGVQNDDGSWSAKYMSYEHNAFNRNEVDNIKSSHPSSESSFVIKNDRLLGLLAPLRAFGDVRFKWRLSELKHLQAKLGGYLHNVVPPNYYTPPYLNAHPETLYHRLTPKDRFLVLASDGLWEQLSPEKVVRLVGDHLEGKQTMEEFILQDQKLSLGELNDTLLQRKSGLAKKAIDANVATHLIRNALGMSHLEVSRMLSYPENVVRYYRDDITITVVFFDSDYLRNCPA